MCLKSDKEYVINLLERELKKSKEKEIKNKHGYKRRVDTIEKTINFIKEEC